MSDTTTIQIKRSTKELLDRRKLEGEKYDSAVRRIMGESGVIWTESELREIIRDEIDKNG